jgi:SAM-dependent methyltransferase
MEFVMKTLDKKSLAIMEFELNWQSPEAKHSEFFYAPNVNMWRDIFPADMERKILGSRENEEFTFTFNPGDPVPGFSPRKVLNLSPGQIRNIHVSDHEMTPQIGRFYPAGLLRNVPGVFPQTLTPFRVVGRDDAGIRVDLNHPLCLYDLELKIRIHTIHQSFEERGGRCTDWLAEVTHNGPGMQARFNGRKTVFESRNSFKRHDEDHDPQFYTAPRLVGHIDTQASSLLQDIYSGILHQNDRVLDLMCSVQSHLPDNYNLSVSGLGLNKLELRKNPILSNYLVHDLNETGLLPYSNNMFDAVVCSLSIEYLTRPREIINEVSRVLVPGGKILLSFSNRWFPPKVTELWLELHDFERMGLVLDYLLENGTFSELSTFSVRNWPRPSDDRHAGEISTSDPIFVVAGSKKLQ